MAKIPSKLGRTAKFGGLVAGQGARWVGTRTGNRFRSEEDAERRSGQAAGRLATQLVEQLGEMKGAAMKIGQVLSTIDLELVPPDEREAFKAKLAALRDQAPSVPFHELEKLVEGELGRPIDEAFSSFEREPMAAASIGQVHRAVTTEGKEVAVKVQYPGIAEAVETDLRNVRLLKPMMRRMAPGLDVDAMLEEVRDRIGEELDYELEAQNQRRVARAYRGHPFVVIPEVDTSRSSRRVLVTEYVEAIGFEDVKKLPDADRDRIGEIVFRFYFGLLERERLASGDPHPGNILALADGRVCFLDFGLMRNVPKDALEGEMSLARAILGRDPDVLHERLATLGYLPDPDAADREALRDFLWAAGAWYLDPELSAGDGLRLTPDYVRETIERTGSPRSPWFSEMRKLSIPSHAMLMRRMESMLLAVEGELRAKAPWHGVVSEYLLGAAPATPLGEQDQEHAATRR